MSASARVNSVEQLARFADDTQRFRKHLMRELECLRVELRKIEAWIICEAEGYWLQESRRAQRRCAEYEQALSRCLSYVRESERRPCTEERKRYQRAVARRETCTQKLRGVKAAMAAWDREQAKFRAKLERCHDLAESQLLVALHELSGQLERLEAYVSMKATPDRKLSNSGRPAHHTDAPSEPASCKDNSGARQNPMPPGKPL